MIEENFIGLAEIAFPAIVFFIERCPVFHAAAPTYGQVPADKTLVAEVFLGPGKSSLNTACGQLFYRCIKNVTQLPSWLYKKIAAESIAIVFDNDVLTALFVECANRVSSGDEI